jgi:predicted acylesterase/phospholipase RssA
MSLIRIGFVVCLALVLIACGTARIPLPESLIHQAEVPGGSTARMWGDELPNDISSRVEIFRQQFGTHEGKNVFDEPITYLAISGGGSSGAFGAGLLKGWSESGTRPELFIVSGVSTGALIAPFAFLGSEYDERLEQLYTSLSTEDLIAGRSLVRGLLSDALFDTRRFREVLQQIVTREMIEDIGREYDRGRRLLIATTNLEAKRPVLWNIGAIARIGTEETNQLIRDIMLASASIPGVFPPVKIKVRVGDQEYDEIHVDGGVSTQVMIYPAQINLKKAVASIGVTDQDQTVYVIRNGLLDARWEHVDLNITSILMSSLDTIIRTQGLGDLYRIYLGALRDEAKYRLAYIPPDFIFESYEMFDPEYMRALFDFGYEKAKTGYPWAKSPPGFVPSE